MDFLCYTIPLAQSSKDCPPCSLLMQTEACTGEKKKEAKVQRYVIVRGATSVTLDGGKRTLSAGCPRCRQSRYIHIREAGRQASAVRSLQYY